MCWTTPIVQQAASAHPVDDECAESGVIGADNGPKLRYRVSMTIAATREPQLEVWDLVGAEYVRGRAHIRPCVDSPGTWELVVALWGRAEDLVTRHRTLSGAMSWGDHYARESIRRAFRTRHTLGVACCSLLALWGVVVASSATGVTSTTTLWIYIAALGCFFVAVRDIAVLLDSLVPDEHTDSREASIPPIDDAIESVYLTVSRPRNLEESPEDRGFVRVMGADEWDPRG
jgi:hypothetical protein